jgi:outer membrane protein assembly factor BamB
METLAVVPIVFNAGAAVLPAILAGAVSIAAVVLRPSQWGRVCREKPWLPVVVVLLIGGIAGGWYFWPAGDTAPQGGRSGRPVAAGGMVGSTDWTAVALAYIRDREAGPRETGSAAQQVAPVPASTAAVISRLNPLRNGFGGGPSPLGLKPLWTHIDPEDDFAQYLGNLAIHGEWLYGASCTLTPPTSAGAVFCLNAVTGERKWVTFDGVVPGSSKPVTFKGIFSSPAITADGKYVVVGEGLHLDRDSALLCFDAETGKLRWRVQTPLHLEGSPAIEGDVAVIGAGAVEVGASHKPKPGDDPGFVLAVKISTGEVLWKHTVNDPESSPVIADGVVYTGSGMNGNAVVALRAEDDKTLAAKGLSREIWRTATDYPAVGAVTLTDDLVIIGCGKGDFIFAATDPAGRVLALDRATGKERWRVELPDTVLAPIGVRGDLAVVPCRNGEVIAIGLADQKVRWSSTISPRSAVMAGAAVTDTHVYAVSNDGYLAVLDIRSGTVLEKHYINRAGRPGELGLSVSGPIVHGGRVYLGSETGGVHAYQGKAQ